MVVAFSFQLDTRHPGSLLQRLRHLAEQLRVVQFGLTSAQGRIEIQGLPPSGTQVAL